MKLSSAFALIAVISNLIIFSSARADLKVIPSKFDGELVKAPNGYTQVLKPTLVVGGKRYLVYSDSEGNGATAICKELHKRVWTSSERHQFYDDVSKLPLLVRVGQGLIEFDQRQVWAVDGRYADAEILTQVTCH